MCIRYNDSQIDDNFPWVPIYLGLQFAYRKAISLLTTLISSGFPASILCKRKQAANTSRMLYARWE